MTRGERIDETSRQILASLVMANASLPMSDRFSRQELVDEAIEMAVLLVDALRGRKLI